MALRAAFVEHVLTEQLPGTVSEAGSTEVNRMDCELSLCMLILQCRELGSKQGKTHNARSSGERKQGGEWVCTSFREQCSGWLE